MFQVSFNQSKKYFIISIAVIILAFLLIVGLIVNSLLKANRAKTVILPRQEIISKLPYFSEGFSVTYSKSKDQLYVNVLKEPYEENRKKALDWLRSKGANPEKLEIFYTPANKFPSNP